MSTLTDEQKLDIAARFSAASGGTDPEARAALYAPNSLTWHNFDDIAAASDPSGRTVAWLRSRAPDLAWTDVATLPTPTGFVSQRIMTGTAPGGPLRVHTCLVVTLDDEGLITRIDEYLDTAQTAVLRG